MGCTCSRIGCVEDADKDALEYMRRLKLHGDSAKDKCLLENRHWLKSIVTSNCISLHVEADIVLSPAEVLQVASAAAQVWEGEVDVAMLAALALIKTGGCANYMHWDKCVADYRCGVCAMQLRVACALATNDGCDRYGVPTMPDMMNPTVAMYFAAASLKKLTACDGVPRSPSFVVSHFWSAAPASHARHHKQDQESMWRLYEGARLALLALQQRCAMLAALPQQHIMHVVQNGETLASIAEIAGVSEQVLMEMNPDLWCCVDDLQKGDVIAVPKHAALPRLHIAQHGDTIDTVAKRYGVSKDRLLRYNPEVSGAACLAEHQVLELPGLRGSSRRNVSRDGARLHYCHVVQPHDELCFVAKRYHCSVDALMTANDGVHRNEELRVGMRLRVPIYPD